jgi:hypothetical protein
MVKLCVKQAVPSYRDTRCTWDYPSSAASLIFLIKIVSPWRTSTSQRRHPRWMRLLLCALLPAITATLIVEPSMSESSRSRRWYHSCLFVFIKQTNGSSRCRSPSPPGRRTIADAAVGLMQVMLTPKHLSPSPSCTLRLVFI